MATEMSNNSCKNSKRDNNKALAAVDIITPAIAVPIDSASSALGELIMLQRVHYDAAWCISSVRVHVLHKSCVCMCCITHTYCHVLSLLPLLCHLTWRVFH